MSVKDTFDKELAKAKAETESVGWVHDERVIKKEEDRIENAEQLIKKREDILTVDKQLEDGLINRIQDDIERELIKHDENIISSAKEKISEMEQKQEQHQKKIDENKELVYSIEDQEKNN